MQYQAWSKSLVAFSFCCHHCQAIPVFPEVTKMFFQAESRIQLPQLSQSYSRHMVFNRSDGSIPSSFRRSSEQHILFRLGMIAGLKGRMTNY